MQRYDSDCTSRTNWSYLAGISCVVFQPAPLNAIESIEAVLAATIKEELLEAYLFEQSNIPSPWNMYWSSAATEGGGIDIHDPVFWLY
jgi:hypothetical protein